MGVSVFYMAVPPSSTLFRRLQSEKAFAALMGRLFDYGSGIFFFFDEIDTTREEILREVIDTYRGVLGPEREARRWINEFRLELHRTRLAYPGIERRKCSLEKTSRLVKERLSAALKQVRSDAVEFTGKLVYGDQVLCRELAQLPYHTPVGLISPPLVREGALVLAGVDAEAVFANDLVSRLESFEGWRRLYAAAAAEEEALLIGVG